jgi:glycyl-tRNA synthetase beta chain
MDADPRTADLLLELGAEEIPARMVRQGLVELRELARRVLDDARLGHGEVETFGAPRRLALVVRSVAARQADRSETVLGPPAKVAYDAEGRPTKAAAAFAARNGVSVERLTVVSTDKGDYLAAPLDEPGRPAATVLPEVVGRLIRELPFPKSMRWGARRETFVRPLHWILALYGDEVVPAEFAGVQSGRSTRGHRFLAPAEVEVHSVEEWFDALKRAFVIVDPVARRTTIEAELSRLAAETETVVRPDDALLDEVTYLVEYPVGIAGAFAPQYLEVPAPVIVSAMRSHQRYFALLQRSSTGVETLTNRFATIAGTVVRDPSLVRRGNERVLAARLADARFFFDEDRQRGLAHAAGKLEQMVFQAKLGSIGAKVQRVKTLALALAPRFGADEGHVARAATLCKADLATQLVGEFPDLQGDLGRAYALLEGEPPEVAQAIEEHYWPRAAKEPPPTTAVGAVLGLADRLDTLVGCFGVGLVPTGSADPYALRRAAAGVVAILLAHEQRGVLLSELVARAAALHGPRFEAARAGVVEFVLGRVRTALSEELPVDVLEAAIAAASDDLVELRSRARALAALRSRAEFAPMATAFKRVANLLKSQEFDGAVAVDPNRFEHPSEAALLAGCDRLRERVESHVAQADYGAALTALAQLAPLVDEFFAAVFVMADDPAVRANRLALLRRAGGLVVRLADVRHLAV